MQLLEQLSFSSNDLKELPLSIENWTSLIELELSGHKFSEIPNFRRLTQLKYPEMNDNQISFLPDFIYGLKNISNIYFALNKITELSEKARNWTKMESVDFSGLIFFKFIFHALFVPFLFFCFSGLSFCPIFFFFVF